jgi:hypothetical protein
VISNLVASLRRDFCVTVDDEVTEVIEELRFDYRDPDGNVRGGRVVNTSRSDLGEVETFRIRIPSPGTATITGTRAGRITLLFCFFGFGDRASVTEEITLFDATGNRSNTISTVLRRSPEFPELPQLGEGLGVKPVKSMSSAK